MYATFRIAFWAMVVSVMLIASQASADVGPGSGTAKSDDVAMMFANVCIKTLPKFEGAKAAMNADTAFQVHPTTGTFYHRKFDLSIKLHKIKGRNVCSLAFSTGEDGQLVAYSFAGGGPVDVPGGIGGKAIGACRVHLGLDVGQGVAVEFVGGVGDVDVDVGVGEGGEGEEGR